ncbi:MAG TPA: hypothetical protein VND64_19580 [Pirellulales bacterium]|nr:hypothetical protein [Pirellulales bacterium]
MNRPLTPWLLATVLASTTATAFADEVDDALAAIAKVGPQAVGSVAARQAHDLLARRGTEVLPKLLAAMDTTNVVAANWCRSAYENIVEREQARTQPSFPLAELRGFVADPAHQGRVRRLALKLLDTLEPEFKSKQIPRMLDDPEFRADAVQATLDAGTKAEAAGDREAAVAEFRKAFEHSRAADQVSQSAARLVALGETTDIVAHLGFVVDWYLIGPFDAPEYSGFATVFPPEEISNGSGIRENSEVPVQTPTISAVVNLQAQYTGQGDRPIGWRRHHSTDSFGQLNLMTMIAPAKEAVGYAYSELVASGELQAELRCGADDNCTVWLNGRRVLAREQWLNGTRLDRFVVPVRLREGTNRLLVKICQGPQHKDPDVPNNWSLQLRFCDATGVGLGLVSGLPPESDRSP